MAHVLTHLGLYTEHMTPTLTLRRRSRTTAHIMRDGQVIGHIGLMAGGSCAFVNASHAFGPSAAFVSHATTVDGGLADLVKVLAS
jgi:hypothetical protein